MFYHFCLYIYLFGVNTVDISCLYVSTSLNIIQIFLTYNILQSENEFQNHEC